MDEGGGAEDVTGVQTRGSFFVVLCVRVLQTVAYDNYFDLISTKNEHIQN